MALALDPGASRLLPRGTAKLHPHSLEAFPELARSCRAETGPGFDKIILFPEGRYREQFASSLPLACVLKPVVTGGPETSLGPASAIDIERALAAETLAHLPHAGPHTLAALERAVWALPRASLFCCADQARVAEAVRGAIQSPPVRSDPEPETKPMVSILIRLHDADPGAAARLASELKRRITLARFCFADGGAVGLPMSREGSFQRVLPALQQQQKAHA